MKQYLLASLLILSVLPFINSSTSTSSAVDRSLAHSSTRQSRWFPFYTIARFQNTPCVGINQLLGTCVLSGECRDAGGVAAGNCTTITRQAVCCIYQQTCGTTTNSNNTYFVNPNYPGFWSGGLSCSITINPCSASVCQLRIDFLDLSLAPPNGDGVCNTDVISISGGASNVPNLCGENSGQHVIVDFSGVNSISISITATTGFTFGRQWNIRVTQLNCNSENRAPSGCLQYHLNPSGIIRGFNYGPSPNAQPNAIGVEGSRQIASLGYGICIKAAGTQCSITYTRLGSDIYSFTLTGDVGAVDPTLLGTGALQEQACTTDYIIIPNPSQGGITLTSGSDRFCGLGINPTTSNTLPFVVYAVTDSTETLDIGNRGFALTYAQNNCPVI